jgi:purine/pyrimidine-nucleoside phosphorylase
VAGSAPEKFENVTVITKANVYFGGKVISHTVLVGGAKKTLGLIYAGEYKFGTDAPERMDITAGACRIRLAGQADWTAYAAGTFFKVPGKSSFEITVAEGIAEYVCSYE